MKKFLRTLIVLIILAGLGLFFGWAQLGVPPDSCGVILSKSHGVYPHVVKPGEFKWIWYKLIPTNTRTMTFRLVPVKFDFSAGNTLPSGGVYSVFAGIENDFTWSINASISFSLIPESLIGLVTEINIGTQEELVTYQNDIAVQIKNFITRRMDSDEFAGRIDTLVKTGESPGLITEISEQYPLVTNISFRINSVKFPDYNLYQETKKLFDDYSALQKEYMAEYTREKGKNRTETYGRFAELEQYGVLLTKYPILLDLLALENEKK